MAAAVSVLLTAAVCFVVGCCFCLCGCGFAIVVSVWVVFCFCLDCFADASVVSGRIVVYDCC